MKRKVTLAILSLLTALSSATFAQQVSIQSNKWSLSWTDSANPVNLAGPGGDAYKPYVLYNAAWPAATRYRVWYDTGTTNSGIAYSTSADGSNWTAGVLVTGINTSGASVNGSNYAGSAVVLYEPSWTNAYRLYYSSQTTTTGQQDIWVAESADGKTFVNNQIALAAAGAGGFMDPFPDGHAVVYVPGRNVSTATNPVPSGSLPFIMYFRYPGASFLAAYSADGYSFTPNISGFVGITNLSDVSTAGNFDVQPVQVLKVSQNDWRMMACDPSGTSIRYLVSSDGANWYIYQDPIANVGSLGTAGSWNDQQNYYATAAYVGGGKFYMLRGGQSSVGGLHRCGAALVSTSFYTGNDFGQWAFYSPFNDWVAEGWAPHTSTAGGSPTGNGYTIIDHSSVDVIQNAGTVTVKDTRTTGSVNFNLVHDAALSVPFTFEYRAKFDSGGTTGTGKDALSKFGVYPSLVDQLEQGAESWQPAISATTIGNWNLTETGNPATSVASIDGTQFQTYTVVCRLDEPSRAGFITNYNTTINPWLCVFEVYTNRNFSAPAVTFRSVGFFGWSATNTTPQLVTNKTDSDGQFTVGIPGPAYGQFTIDWLRWGNGVILDALDPGVPLALTIAPSGGGVQLTWPGGTPHAYTNTYNLNYWVDQTSTGLLQSTTNLVTGPWVDELGATSGSVFALTNKPKYFRVKR